MPAFVYRLQTLLEQREGALEEAQRALAARVRELDEAKQTLTHLEAAAKTAGLLAQSAAAALSAPGLVTGVEFLERVERSRALRREAGLAKDEALEQMIAVQDAGDRVDESRAALAEAMRAVEVLRKHRQRALEKFRRSEESKEALEMDEAGVAQFNRRGA